MRIRPFTIYREDPTIYGTTTDGYHWTFVIPDSIFEISKHFGFKNRMSDSLNMALGEHQFPNVNFLIFQTIINGDTLQGHSFNFERDEMVVELAATFDTTRRLDNTMHFAEHDTTIILQVLLTDYFITPLPQNNFLRESMQMPNFGIFWDRNNPDLTYIFVLEKSCNACPDLSGDDTLLTADEAKRNRR